MRMQPGTPTNQFNVYRIASDHGLSAKDTFTLCALVILVGATFGHFFHPWYTAIAGGFAKNAGVIYGQWALGTTNAWTYGGVVGPDAIERWGYIISSIIVVWICYMLRMRFPWFFINPSAFVAMSVLNSWWINTVLAFVLKYITLKIGGARAYEEYGVPLAVGYTIGYGLGLVIIGATAFFSIALPGLLSS